MADLTCPMFDTAAPSDATVLHRFVVGADEAPAPMTAADVKTLRDPFATLLLAKGKIPGTAEAVVEGIKGAVGKTHPLRRQSTFVLGEGSQLPETQETADVERIMRFIVTLGRGPEGPDVFLSVADPKRRDIIEVMAWDRKAGGFNYYRASPSTGAWMFAGNSRDALRDPSRGKGPFESHPSGALVMKELKTPWQNWDSPSASVAETAFAPNDRRRRHPWFVDKEPGGALTLETDAARPAIARWARERFRTLRDKGGAVERPRQVMEQILDTPTVNLITTHVESRALEPKVELDLPTTFFIDAEGLSDVLGLTPPPPFTVTGRIYAKCLTKFKVHLDDDAGFTAKGDTHFCFLVPERAFEDQVVLREAIEIGLLSRRLATCLLLVDPWNPVFSERRRALLRHVPQRATIKGGKSSFSSEMAKAILNAPEAATAGTPEAEFAKRWKVGSRFAPEFNRMLTRYYDAVGARLKTQAGFESYFKLADERRQVFKETMPIAEFPLLLPRTNIKPARRRMKRDATVVAEG